MDERVTICARCNAMIPWGRVLCEVCLDGEILRRQGESGRPREKPPPLPRVECRSCYTPVDQRALLCPHCGLDPRAEFWDAAVGREPHIAGPFFAAAYLLVGLPLLVWLMLTVF